MPLFIPDNFFLALKSVGLKLILFLFSGVKDGSGVNKEGAKVYAKN